MSHDTECPYCGAGVDSCHDDGYGYDESRPHNQTCHECDKTFVFRTTILYHYETEEAPCLNGGDHSWRRQILYGHEGTSERGICDSCEKTTPIRPVTVGPFVPSETKVGAA